MTRNLALARNLTLSETIEVRRGSILAGRIRNDKTTYASMEDVHGRLSTVHSGDIVVGALGHRNALQGYEGILPERVEVGETLNLLNMGGVIGIATSYSPEVGPPFELEVLGQVLSFPDFRSRVGRPANIDQKALSASEATTPIPVIYIAGTCMNSGKTAAACALVRKLAKSGLRVGGAKLTGVSLVRDILAMRDYGAEWCFDFTDTGVATSSPETAQATARSIFAELARKGAEIVVAETGDGIMGEYGVQAILADADLMRHRAAIVLCANDPVGVAGGIADLRTRYGLEVDIVAGPATDNEVGVRFVERGFGVRAINARRQSDRFAQFLLEKVNERCAFAR